MCESERERRGEGGRGRGREGIYIDRIPLVSLGIGFSIMVANLQGCSSSLSKVPTHIFCPHTLVPNINAMDMVAPLYGLGSSTKRDKTTHAQHKHIFF